MKHLLTLFALCLFNSATAQLLKTETQISLPTFLTSLEYSSLKTNYTFNTKLKAYTFSIDQLDKMRRGDFIFSTKNINKNFSYLEIPNIDLNKELRKVMHKVPGEYGTVRAEGFTL